MKPRCIECYYRVPKPLHYFIGEWPIHRKCLVSRIVRESINKIWKGQNGHATNKPSALG